MLIHPGYATECDAMRLLRVLRRSFCPPYGAAMQQAEGGIKNLNQDVTALNTELSAAVALRNSELTKAGTAYCYDTKGKKIDDAVQCGTGVGEAPGA